MIFILANPTYLLGRELYIAIIFFTNSIHG